MEEVEEVAVPPRLGPAPDISYEEGYQPQELNFSKIEESRKRDMYWYRGLKWWDRLYHHTTHAGVRRDVLAKAPFRPKDSLDFVLQTKYNQFKDFFPEKTDVYLQPISSIGDYCYPEIIDGKICKRVPIYLRKRAVELGTPKWKQVEKDFPPDPFFRRSAEDEREFRAMQNRRSRLGQYSGNLTIYQMPIRPYMHHHVVNGGFRERRNPFNVRLNISSHQSTQTKDGYGRKPDGSYYSI